MSLDDAIRQARQQADMWDEAERRKMEREQQERDEVLALGKEAAEKLADWGNEEYVRIQPAKWYQLGGYRDPESNRYSVVSRQRCWVLVEVSGIRGRDPNGPFLDSPVLLLSDGTIGRFWPKPQRLHPPSTWPDVGTVEYVSTLALDSVEDDTFSIGHAGARTYVEAVKRRLGEAVVAYERAGVRRLND